MHQSSRITAFIYTGGTYCKRKIQSMGISKFRDTVEVIKFKRAYATYKEIKPGRRKPVGT